MQITAEFHDFDVWAPLEAIAKDRMSPRYVARATRRNDARLKLQAPYRQAVIRFLEDAGVPADRLAPPKPKAAVAIEKLTRTVFGQMRRLDVIDVGPIRAPPHIRALALVRRTCANPARRVQTAFLNYGSAPGGGDLTRDHLDRGERAYCDHMFALGQKDVAVALINSDARELQALEAIYGVAVQSRDFRGLGGADLAEAIHASAGLDLVIDDYVAALSLPMRPRLRGCLRLAASDGRILARQS